MGKFWKRKGKRKFSRRRGKKHQKGRLTMLKNPSFGLPDEYVCKLQYTDNYQFVPVTTGTVLQVWKCNSISSIDRTVSNSIGNVHRPTNYNQLFAVYNRYLVMACKVTFEFVNNAATGSAEVYAGWSDLDPTGDGIVTLQEYKYSARRVLGPSTGYGIGHFKMYTRMATIFGQKHLDQDALKYSVFGSDPTDGAYLYFGAGNLDNVTTSDIILKATIVQYVKFKARIDPPVSTHP